MSIWWQPAVLLDRGEELPCAAQLPIQPTGHEDAFPVIMLGGEVLGGRYGLVTFLPLEPDARWERAVDAADALLRKEGRR